MPVAYTAGLADFILVWMILSDAAIFFRQRADTDIADLYGICGALADIIFMLIRADV